MNKYQKHIFAFAAGLICLVIYILTLHPSVGFVDCGELAGVCYTFGVPHPTGYPLFLIIGYLFSHLPLGGSIIYRLNLLTAIETSIAVVITFYSAFNLLKLLLARPLKNIHEKEAKNQSKGAQQTGQKFDDKTIYWISFFTALCFGFVKTVWFYATQIEVYALHSLCISLVVYFSIKIISDIKKVNKKAWIGLFVTVGLSFANHSTSIYYIPGLIYLYYIQYKEFPAGAKSVLPFVLFMVPGMMLYLILMLIAASGPFFNWSNPVTFSALWNHVRGADFSQLMFSSSVSYFSNAAKFFKEAGWELAFLPGLAGITGLFYIYRQNRNILVLFLLFILTSLLYSFTYETVEIQSFYLLAYYTITLAVSAGIVYSLNLFGKKGNFAGGNLIKRVITIGVMLCILALGINYRQNDNSKNHVNEDLTLNTLEHIEPNAILLTYDWAFVYSSSLYYQQAEKLRGDVKVFNVRFFSAPWYLETISRYYPDVYVNIKQEAEDYIKSYNGNDLKLSAAKLSALVKAFVEKESQKFPFYMTFDFVYNKETNIFLSGFTFKPEGIVYKLVPKNDAYDPNAGVESLNFVIRHYEPNSAHKQKMFTATPGMYYDNAYYHFIHGSKELALKFTEKALEFDPNFKDALTMRNKILNETKPK